MILDDGCAWNGCVYRSLSQVAKAITGTNWNGHRFFGLKAVRTGASGRKRNVTPRPNSLLDIGLPPTLAGFAPAMPDRSLPRGFSVKRLTDLPMLWSEQWRAVGLREPIQVRAELG